MIAPASVGIAHAALGSLGWSAALARQGAVRSAMVWAAVLGGVVILAGVLLLVVKFRTSRAAREADAPGSVFEDLRRMRDQGQITSEEYEQMRSAAADRLRGNTRPRAPRISPAEARIETEGEIRAREGYDLTGTPLPGAHPPPGPRGPQQGPDTGGDAR